MSFTKLSLWLGYKRCRQILYLVYLLVVAEGQEGVQKTDQPLGMVAEYLLEDAGEAAKMIRNLFKKTLAKAGKESVVLASEEYFLCTRKNGGIANPAGTMVEHFFDCGLQIRRNA